MTYEQTRNINITDNWRDEYEPIQWIKDSWYQHINDEITTEEVQNVIENAPKDKATGPSGLSYDMLKLIRDEEIFDRIKDLLNVMMINNRIPEKEQLGSIILLPKIQNWQGELPKLRPITLLEILRKVYSTILTKRLTVIIDKHNLLNGYNFGFRTGCGTGDALLLIRACIDDASMAKHTLLMAS
jgi:hypothetical protein